MKNTIRLKSNMMLAVIILAVLGVTLVWVVSDRTSKGKLVLRVPWGEEKGELGFLPHHEGYEDQGPMSFFVTPKNQIYVLDTVNRRINVYSDGSFSYDIKLQIHYYPHDLLIDEDVIYVLTDMTIAKLDAAGKPLAVHFVKHKSYSMLWNIYKAGQVLVIKVGEGSPDDVVCFTTELQSVDCSLYQRLYQEHEVVTFTSDGLMVIPDGERLQVRSVTGTEAKTSTLTFEEIVSDEIYPRTTSFRIVDGRVYSAVPDRMGISFFEFIL